MTKYALFSLVWVLTSTFCNANYGHPTGSGVIRNHIDTFTLIQDMFTNQAKKYAGLFTDPSSDSENATAGKQEVFKNSMWSNVHKYTKLFLGKTDGKKGKRYRRLGGEKPSEVTHAIYQQHLEN